FVDPAELLGLAARPAEPSEYFSVQRQLVHATRVSIGAVEVLRARTGSDADSPGRAGSRHVLGCASVAEPGFGVRRDRNIDGDDLLEIAVVIEHLDTAISAVGHIDV